MKTVIPIFFSVNDARSPFLATAICSIKANASMCYAYHVHILYDTLSPENREKLSRLADDDFVIEFDLLAERFASLPEVQRRNLTADVPLDVYFRFFIAELYPQYDKAICLDTDVLVPGDISLLFEEYLGAKLLGAVVDYSIQKIAPLMHYVDKYLGVDHQNYVNSAVILLNCKGLRSARLAARFLDLAMNDGLETVAADQDYLNVLCVSGIHYLDPDWNAMPSDCLCQLDNPQIIHFNITAKPWLNETVPFDNLFWEYAALSGYEAEIRARRRAFLQDSAAVKNYRDVVKQLMHKAARLTQAPDSFRTRTIVPQELRLCS